MQLNEWLFKNHISKKQFAEKIGYSRTHLHHVMSGLHPATIRMIIRVLKATEGEVKLGNKSKKRKK